MDQSSSLIKLAQRILEEAEKVEGSNIDEELTRALFEATRELQISVLTVLKLLEDR
jgi:6-hydroxytryprostatin B O-methyltransferase